MLVLATLWDEPHESHPGERRSSEPAPFAVVPEESASEPLPPLPPEEAHGESEAGGSRRRKRQKATLASTFDDRLRESAQGFNFAALISTGHRPEPKPPKSDEDDSAEPAVPIAP